jgi:hypothetical protein
MSPQSLQAAVAIVITFLSGILASRGIISKETQDYLGGPETLAFVGVVCAFALGAWRWYANRPHGIIQSAAALPQVDAVVVKPKTASEIPVANVVGSLTEAARVPGVSAN